MRIRQVIAVFMIVVGTCALCHGQESFSDLTTPHFRIRFQEGVLGTKARFVGDYLEQDFGYLRKALGLEPGRIIEFRLYGTQAAFRTGTRNRQAHEVEFERGIVHVAPVGLLERNGVLAQILSYGLSRAMLEQSTHNGAPGWLAGSFAVYHSGMMADLPVPAGRRVSEFSDLTQELQEASGSSEMDRVNYLLGMTMKFFVDTFGEEQAFGLFAAFDGRTGIGTVFEERLQRPYEEVQRLWDSYLSDALENRTGDNRRGN